MRVRPFTWLLIGIASLLLVLTGCSQESGPTTDAVSDQPTQEAPSTLPASAPVIEPVETLPASVEEGSPDVVATVNGVPISVAQFERTRQQVLSRYQQIYSQFGQDVRTMLGGAQGRLFDLRMSDEALEQATVRALVLGELIKQNATISEDRVANEFRNQYDEFLDFYGMDEASFKAGYESGTLEGLQTGDFTYDQFVEYAEQSVREELETQAIKTLIAGTIAPSTEDLVAYFEAHRSDYDIAEQVRASHILVADQEVAQQLLDELDAGGDFAALAQEYSIDTGSAARGGDLGWFKRGRMVAPFEQVAFSTPVGERSGLVSTDYGYHIIWVTDYQPEVKPPFEEVAESVAADYAEDVKTQRFTEWYALARPSAEVVIAEPMLHAFRTQQDDLELGLQAFVAIRNSGTTDDPYLNYIIGSIYETMMDNALSKKRGLEASATLTPSQQTQIVSLESEIESYKSQALASYEAALAILGSEPEIKTRIENLRPTSIGEDAAAPPQ